MNIKGPLKASKIDGSTIAEAFANVNPMADSQEMVVAATERICKKLGIPFTGPRADSVYFRVEEYIAGLEVKPFGREEK